jgi:signal transduction histidine kinase
VVGTIAIITDITGRKQAELKLHEKNQELDSFTYKASHDLKGPLASIIGLSNVAHDEVKDEKALHYFDLIEKSTKRLDAILTDLIDLARLNKTIAELQPISVENLIQDIIESLKHRMGAEKMTFTVDVATHREFKTDVNLLTSILQNLIVNSINYHNSENPAPRIDIRVMEKGDQLLFSIEDNGVGIPEKMKDRVFEMFYRANTKSTGSGLGLYIVKNSIEKLHGEYHLKSEEGEGTTFTFSLPFQLSLNGSALGQESALPPQPQH